MPKTTKRPVHKHVSKRKPKPTHKKVHWVRFLPAILIASFATYLSWQPQLMRLQAGGVLAYATNTSPSGLLSATNVQRSNNGVASLSANSLLNAAAQAKAEDMVNRNYWSHNTPDGQQPWVFINNVGYQYLSAGENLAYGFLDSSSTVTGWMNSPPHKANLLSVNFTEVGFGIANSSNYVNNGQQTVVVAMYGKPQVASANTSTPSAPVSQSASKPAAAPAATPAPTPAPAETPTPEPEPEEVVEEPVPEEEIKEEEIAIALTSSGPTKSTAAPSAIERIKMITNGQAIWSTTALIVSICFFGLAWAVHRGIHLKRYIMAGEQFFMHHMYLDMTILAMIFLAFVLLTSSGFVR